MKTKILLVDDHPIYREGLAQLLSSLPIYDVVNVASDSGEAYKMVEESKPDLVILDLSLGKDNGLELIKGLKALHDNLKFIILSMHDEFIYAERAMAAGAHAYVQKKELTSTVLEAVKTVCNGKKWYSPEIKERFFNNLFEERNEMGLPGLSKLSDRELEVFNWIGRGLGSARIAEILGLSVKTIDTHKEHLKQKLNCVDTQELRIKATEWYSRE